MEGVASDGSVAHDPSVHVDTSRLDDDTFGGLGSDTVSRLIPQMPASKDLRDASSPYPPVPR